MSNNAGLSLDAILKALVTENYEATIEKGKGENPDQLLIELEEDGQGRTPLLQILMLQGMEDTPVIQYFVRLPYEFGVDVEAGLFRFLCMLNPNLILSGFEYAEGQKLLYFRYNQRVTLNPSDMDHITWAVMMIEFQVLRFGSIIEALVSGNLTFENARLKLVENLMDWTDENE